MIKTYSTLPLVLWAALSLYASGALTAAESTHREHSAHEHGHGVLEIVAQGAELQIALRIPAVNAVGFEHAPSTEQQHQLIEQTIARFRLGQQLFLTTDAAGCKLVSADVELAGMDDGHEGESHEKDAHSSEEHDDHKEEHHDDHKEEHHKEAHHEEGHKEAHHNDEGHKEDDHSELHAEYHFRCTNLAQLKMIDVRVFEALSDVEEIEAQVVTETFQGATDLTVDNTLVKLM